MGAALIERWLTAPIVQEDGTIIERSRSTPQGSVVSPMLANRFMHYAFDLWMARMFPDLRWCRYAAHELKPLWHRLRELLLASSKLCVDQTPAPVLDPGRGTTKTGYFWALSRDDRPWAGPDPPEVVYAYAPGRGAVHGLRLLGDYRGIIHCDGYQAYKIMTRETRADALSGTLAFCWSHLRRQFVKIEREAAPAPAPVAREALERIAQLYADETPPPICGRALCRQAGACPASGCSLEAVV